MCAKGSVDLWNLIIQQMYACVIAVYGNKLSLRDFREKKKTLQTVWSIKYETNK